MMGHHSRSEALFYYFWLEDNIPEIICCGATFQYLHKREIFEFGEVLSF